VTPTEPAGVTDAHGLVLHGFARRLTARASENRQWLNRDIGGGLLKPDDARDLIALDRLRRLK
jgi:hypothetical protein